MTEKNAGISIYLKGIFIVSIEAQHKYSCPFSWLRSDFFPSHVKLEEPLGYWYVC